MSTLFLEYVFCHLGGTDGWMGKTSNNPPLSRQCFTVSNAVLTLFQALDPASIIRLSLPYFPSFLEFAGSHHEEPRNCN